MKIATAVLLLVAVLMGGQAHAAPVIQATLTMGNGTAGMGIDVATRKVFVSNYADGTLTVVHADTLAVLGTVPVGVHPRRLIVNSASNLVYVVNDNAPGSVTVIETGSYGIVATIPVGNNPRTACFDPTGKRAFVATPALAAGVRPVVEASHPLVEGVLMKHPATGRQAVTLLEVLFSIGIVAVGLLGVLLVVPLAGNRSAHGAVCGYAHA